MKYVVGFLGIIITICGFTLDNIEHFKFIYKIITPSYTKAMIAYDKMYEKDFTLREGDIGFNEISEIIKSTLRDASDTPLAADKISQMKITQIKTIKSGLHQIFSPGIPRVEDFIELETSFQSEQPATGFFRSLKEKIKEKYLTNTFVQWKIYIFVIGIVLVIVSLFL